MPKASRPGRQVRTVKLDDTEYKVEFKRLTSGPYAGELAILTVNGASQDKLDLMLLAKLSTQVLAVE